MTCKPGIGKYTIGIHPVAKNACVAQMVEHLTFNQGVGGSNPLAGIILP